MNYLYKDLCDKRVQRVLGKNLSEQQLYAIYEGWFEFYKNPEKYKNSIVVDMVLLSLNMD